MSTWSDLSLAFLEKFSFNLDLIPWREDLVALKQKPNKSFGEYVGHWSTLASQVKNKLSKEESIEIITWGAQPATRGLLSIQPVTNLASLIRIGTRVESSLQSGNFPALAAFPK